MSLFDKVERGLYLVDVSIERSSSKIKRKKEAGVLASLFLLSPSSPSSPQPP